MKRLRAFLVLVAFLVWARVVQQLVWPIGAPGGGQGQGIARLPADWPPNLASPFPMSASTAPPRKVPSKTTGERKKPILLVGKAGPADSSPPPRLQAILWGPDPVAILEKEGGTELLHRGQMFQGWKVLQIQIDRVKIQNGRRKLELIDQ